MNSPSESNQHFFRIFFLCLTAAIGGFLFGFDSGVINGTVGALQLAFGSSSVGTGFNVASMLIGCAVGAFFAGTLADRMGRKPVMILTAIAFLISAWGSGISSSSFEFVLYRMLGGLAVGAASILAPAYISEVAPAKIRGALASLQQLMIVFGLFMAFLSNYLIADWAGSAEKPFWWGFQAWQWMFWVEMLPSLIFFLALLLIPESPRYLVAAGKPEQAKRVLASITSDNEAAEKVKEIQSTLAKDHRPSLRDLLNQATGKIHPILWVGIGLAALQQFVGINVVFYYGAVLWQAAGFSEADALMTNVISGAVNIGSTFLAIALVDRLGRKPLLLAGSIGMAVSLGLMAVFFGQGTTNAAGHLSLSPIVGTLALIAANAYVFCFAFSWGPVMWVMLGEMFPNQYRGAALAVCGFIQWISNFAITMTFPVMLKGMGLALSYSVYAFFAAVSVWFVYKAVRETKGKTLEQMSGD